MKPNDFLKVRRNYNHILAIFFLETREKKNFSNSLIILACSRRSDSGARAKTKASERAGKNEGRLGERTRERL